MAGSSSRRGSALTVPVLTNTTYAESIEFLGRHRGFGGDDPLPAGTDSLARFARAAGVHHARPGLSGARAAFAVLDDVRMPDYTKWNIVYLPKQQRIYWRTTAQERVKSIDLRTFANAVRHAGTCPRHRHRCAGRREPAASRSTHRHERALVRCTYANMVVGACAGRA